MIEEKLLNIFRQFDFALLNDPEFREDAVREELIAPLLKTLGYSPSGDCRIVRSRRLKHPFINIGSRQKSLNLVPDYLFEVHGTPAWVLDAKSPTENLDDSKHLEQAYSYAIHPEIRVPYFALCNGRRFVLYHISNQKPLIDFQMVATAAAWENLIALVGPHRVLQQDHKLKKDLGLHLRRMGFHEFGSLIFPLIPISTMSRISRDLFTFSAGLVLDGQDTYVATFDFDEARFRQLKGKIPQKAIELLHQPIDKSITTVHFADSLYRVSVECVVGTELHENEDEIFLPLKIIRLLESEVSSR